MIESWQIQLPENLEMIRQIIGDLPVDNRKKLYAALQHDENRHIKVPKICVWAINEMLKYTKEMWPLMCGVTRSDKVWFVKEWDRIPVCVIK